MSKPKAPSSRASYRHWTVIPTRWMDNDAHGHINNAIYYSYFDTVIGAFLIRAGGAPPGRGEALPFCVENGCRYFAPLAFPQAVEAGLRVAHLGTSSVRYELGLFAEGSESAAAEGYFVHVFVDAKSHRPVPIPARLRRAMQALSKSGPA